jgi:uncharacterized protein YecE (DUF72 family)
MNQAKVPAAWRPYVRLGTCSWKYDSWKGTVYDKGKTYRPDEYLADYARRYDSVEVDQWFWSLFPDSVRLPLPSVVKRYAESVPDGFVFTVKAPNAITLTHHYNRKEAGEKAGSPNPDFLSVELLEGFLERLAPMGKKLGPVMFQFEYLNKQKMATRGDFLERMGGFLGGAPKGYAYAIELRNPNYLAPDLFAMLKEHRAGFVYLEGYYMPPIGEVFEKFHPATAPFSVVRLHGGDRGEIEKETGEVWDRIVAPKPEALRAAARITRENIREKIVTYVNVNNHFEGSAPLSIDRFTAELAKPEGPY